LDAKRLEALSRTIFPQGNWKTELARLLEVDPSTVRRWCYSGRIPKPVEVALEVLVKMIEQ
jgi:hypothetical protein